MTSVLLVNSDLAANRGDRAIAEGNVQLVKDAFPDARVTGISQHPERDRAWYGIDFLDMDFQSLHPRDLVRLLRAARRSDLVLWGGGEILKDYTNKAALWYWVSRMTLVSMVAPRLYGMFQGIGPTASPVSRRLIAFVVNRCAGFVVRDDESREKLIAWGARPEKVVAASDPAVLPEAAPVDEALARRLTDELGVEPDFLADAVCVAPRDWFHYKPGGLLPYKYAKRLPWRRRRPADDARHATYLAHLERLVAELTGRGHHVLLLPMHMGENDPELCRRLAAHATDPALVRVLDRDVLSPAELRSVVAATHAMVGFRLHSTIVGVSGAVPSVNVYYVDKGRVFFEQIGQQRFSLPIERAVDADFVPTVLDLLDRLLAEHATVRDELRTATDRLRTSVVEAFDQVVVRGRDR